MLLAEHIYQLTSRLPSDERYGLTAQMRRSAVSIPSNLAEGYGRNLTGSFLQFLRIAQGSLRELETQVALSVRLKFLPPESIQQSRETATTIGKLLRALIRSLENRK